MVASKYWTSCKVNQSCSQWLICSRFLKTVHEVITQSLAMNQALILDFTFSYAVYTEDIHLCHEHKERLLSIFPYSYKLLLHNISTWYITGNLTHYQGGKDKCTKSNNIKLIMCFLQQQLHFKCSADSKQRKILSLQCRSYRSGKILPSLGLKRQVGLKHNEIEIQLSISD